MAVRKRKSSPKKGKKSTKVRRRGPQRRPAKPPGKKASASQRSRDPLASPDALGGASLFPVDLSTPTAIQPAWIAKRFPDYAHDHGMRHELTSVRTADHEGHSIEITTTYRIRVNGKNVHLHAIVGHDGQLHCHTTPYVNYSSAVDLVRALLDRYPDAFPNRRDEGNEGGAHHHGGADH